MEASGWSVARLLDSNRRMSTASAHPAFLSSSRVGRQSRRTAGFSVSEKAEKADKEDTAVEDAEKAKKVGACVHTSRS